MKKISTGTKGILLATITAVFWGFLAVVLKIALQKVDAFTIVWLRFTIAFSALFIYFAVTDRSQYYIFRKLPLYLLLAAFCLGLNYLSFLKGLHFTSPSNAQVIIQVGPILLGIAGVLFFKEKINALQILGFVIAGVGLYFFYNEQLKVFVHSEEAYNKGLLWVIFAAVTWAVFAIFQKILVRKHPPQTLNMIIYGLPALLFLPLANFSSLQGLSFPFWLLLIFLGVNTLIAYGCLALAFKYTEAYKISIIVTMNPLITLSAMLLIGFFEVSWIAKENLTPLTILGASLVLAGAVFAIYFSKKNKTH